MNLDKLISWTIGAVLAFAAYGQLDTLQLWIWRAQARIIYESRSSTWGSPRFFPAHEEPSQPKPGKRTNSNYVHNEPNQGGTL